MSGYAMGDDVTKMISQNGSQCNSSIDAGLTSKNVSTNAPTKIVPLYSTDAQKVVGAAQVTGDATAVAQTQSVVISACGNNMYKFAATSCGPTAMATQPTYLNGVVVSSILMVPAPPAPAAACPPPAPSQAPTCAPGCASGCPSGEGTEGSGY
jgi:hypothetical protein